MPDPKTGALPLGDAPKSLPGEARQNLARCAHCASIVVAPNRATWKDAPTSFKVDILNGALLRILFVKNPKYCRAAPAQQGNAGARIDQSNSGSPAFRFNLKNNTLKL